jgi:hypothetical protein
MGKAAKYKKGILTRRQRNPIEDSSQRKINLILTTMAIKAKVLSEPKAVVKLPESGGRCSVDDYSHEQLQSLPLSTREIDEIRQALSQYEFEQYRILVWVDRYGVKVMPVALKDLDRIGECYLTSFL